MPHEVISTTHPHSDRGYTPSDETVRISLAWGRGEDLPPHLNLITAVQRVDEDEHQRSTSWEPQASWILNRDDVNRLIRNLRRARNTVFGQDE